mmetsp:Transcript_102833/g.286337  ORF Transcript_102833/g.286337 Transcript_102833/m.286337 type:complete len:265 (+) Transcript_102833:1178-1972(+)
MWMTMACTTSKPTTMQSNVFQAQSLEQRKPRPVPRKRMQSSARNQKLKTCSKMKMMTGNSLVSRVALQFTDMPNSTAFKMIIAAQRPSNAWVLMIFSAARTRQRTALSSQNESFTGAFKRQPLMRAKSSESTTACKGTVPAGPCLPCILRCDASGPGISAGLDDWESHRSVANIELLLGVLESPASLSAVGRTNGMGCAGFADRARGPVGGACARVALHADVTPSAPPAAASLPLAEQLWQVAQTPPAAAALPLAARNSSSSRA